MEINTGAIAATGRETAMWLNGEVLMCACPDCRAPMTVRLWLMVADCWQCGASIELTEEQEREAQRLLDQAAEQRRERTAAVGASTAAAGNSATSPVRTPTRSGGTAVA